MENSAKSGCNNQADMVLAPAPYPPGNPGKSLLPNLPKFGKIRSLTPGSKFGSWTILGRRFQIKSPSGKHCAVVVAQCDCGIVSVVRCGHLLNGKSTGCGCGAALASRKRFTTHGDSRSRDGLGSFLYRVWKGMKERCEYPRHVAFAKYGGRGIRVCEAWHDYATFRTWALANGWRRRLTIDRVDIDGDYSPSNCRIVTNRINCRNKSNNRLITMFGESKCMAAWADDPRCAVSWTAFRKRIYDGWAPEEAFTCGPRNPASRSA